MSNTAPYTEGDDLAPRHGPAVLVVDDTDAAAAAMAAMLREHYTVTVARSVGDALAALAVAPLGFAACVLDLVLDTSSARLHDTLARLDVPVVLVSGVEAEQLPAVAKVHGWRYLAKPFEGPALLATLEQMLSGARAPSRRTRTPPKATAAQPGAELTPPDGTPSARSPGAWPEAVEAVVDKLTRRVLRGGIALAMVKLQLAGKMAPGVLVGLTICALGVEGVVRSVREKKPAAIAAVFIPLLLGAAGRATGLAWLSDASVWVTAIGLPLAGYVLPSPG